jgi:hypothetical protein
LKYTLADEYFKLTNKPLKIGEQYLAGDVEHILVSLSGDRKKIGSIENDLSESLTRNQLKHLLPKLLKDAVPHICSFNFHNYSICSVLRFTVF